jgi:hypothetical protein
MGDMRNAYKILVGKTDWKRTLRRSWRRWANNIKTDVKRGRVILCGMGSLARHLVRTAMIIPVTYSAGDFVCSRAASSLSRHSVPLQLRPTEQPTKG